MELTKPEWITGSSSAIWDQTIEDLEGSGNLTALDQTILAQFCLLSGLLADRKTEFTTAHHTQLRLCTA